MLTTLAAAGLVALVVLAEVRPWCRPAGRRTLEVTVTVDLSDYRQVMADLDESFRRLRGVSARAAGRSVVDVSTLNDPESIWYPTDPEESIS